ncbi:hypothetical protein GALL_173190 [mine drainage metagenome]|uniref:DUF3822 domain-containing protein n=1 Tax=mine drainage metagenome TaxID=410659 RepID=A0A1J5SG12_9ZZZZ
MVQKQISIYGELETQSPFNSDQLVLELSNTHIAMMVKFSGKKHVGAFELFGFDSNAMGWYDIFHQVRVESIILDRSYNDTRLFFNLNEAVVMPAQAFNTNAADAYLTAVHGDSTNHIIRYDNIVSDAGLINVYRIKKSLHDIVNSNLMMVTPRHVYSKLLENVLNNNVIFQGAFLKLDFYNNQMNVVLLKNGILHLIQSYSYQTPDDVLYYLLNIAEKFDISTTETPVEVSGLIDIKSQYFDYIEKIFKQISFETLKADNIFSNYSGEYPPHYFTPFLNLTV